MPQPMRSPFEGFAALDVQGRPEEVALGSVKSQMSLLHRVRAKIVPLSSGRSGSTSASGSLHAGAAAAQPNWLDMPRHLLEEIFANLLKDGALHPTARKVSRYVHQICSSCL